MDKMKFEYLQRHLATLQTPYYLPKNNRIQTINCFALLINAFHCHGDKICWHTEHTEKVVDSLDIRNPLKRPVMKE
jgi:hypothetical protein